MRNRMYGGVRGRKMKVGRKLLRFPPTRFLVGLLGGFHRPLVAPPCAIVSLAYSMAWTNLRNLNNLIQESEAPQWNLVTKGMLYAVCCDIGIAYLGNLLAIL